MKENPNHNPESFAAAMGEWRTELADAVMVLYRIQQSVETGDKLVQQGAQAAMNGLADKLETSAATIRLLADYAPYVSDTTEVSSELDSIEYAMSASQGYDIQTLGAGQKALDQARLIQQIGLRIYRREVPHGGPYAEGVHIHLDAGMHHPDRLPGGWRQVAAGQLA